jgi:hypothetical protein
LPPKWGGEVGIVRINNTTWRLTDWVSPEEDEDPQQWKRHWKSRKELVVAATITNRRARYGTKFQWETYTVDGVNLGTGWNERCRNAAKSATENLQKVLTLKVLP